MDTEAIAELLDELGGGSIRYLTVDHRNRCAEAAESLRAKAPASGSTDRKALRSAIHARIQRGGPMHSIVADIANLM